MKRRLLSLLLAVMVLYSLTLPAVAAEETRQVTVLFTSDLHSHFLPAKDEQGNSYGGYARLKTVIDRQKALAPDAVLLDAGDFSMGSLFQTIYTTVAAELRLMGVMGYDVTTFGNHEFDYHATGLVDMLNAAVDGGGPLPQIVEANYNPPMPGEDGYDEQAQATWDALNRYGVQEYTVLNRGGVNIAVFGMMGFDSDGFAPTSGMILQDPAETAQRIVDQIREEVAEPRMIVCLSHSGTSNNPKKSEDELLAKAVDGIDLLISGHSHTTLTQAIQVNDTYIVSCGEYSKYLGVAKFDLTGDGVALTDYSLLPVDDTVADDGEMLAGIEACKRYVESYYLHQFGDWGFDTVLAYNPLTFGSQDDLYIHQESAFGNLIADAYAYAVEQAEDGQGAPVDFAVTVNGLIRESLAVGDVTVEDVFNVESLGIGPDGVSGYPLVTAWVTGRDLKNIFEVDATVTALMPEAQLHISGMTFTYHPFRMFFDKVIDCAQVLPDGTQVPIEDDRLYRVATGLYTAQMLGMVEEQTFGILKIVPRDASGEPITNMEEHIVYDQSGNEVKEWYAIASYLESMGTISHRYASTDGRKIASNSLSPVALLKDANWLTVTALAVLLILVLLLVLAVRLVLKLVKKVRKPKQ